MTKSNPWFVLNKSQQKRIRMYELKLRKLCHTSACKATPDRCPQSCSTHFNDAINEFDRCQKYLGLHTAMAWLVADDLRILKDQFLVVDLDHIIQTCNYAMRFSSLHWLDYRKVRDAIRAARAYVCFLKAKRNVLDRI